MPDDNLREQVRKKYYQESLERNKERELKRLNEIFSILGNIDSVSPSLYFLQHEFKTFDEIRQNVESGDRKAMLALLLIMADSLHTFEVMPSEIRMALADALQKMRINLAESHGFLPVKRGQSTETKNRAQSNKEYWTAYSVELHRYKNGCSLEDAIAIVAEEKGLTDSLVHKRWKKKHKEAKKTLELMSSVLKLPYRRAASKPRRIR